MIEYLGIAIFFVLAGTVAGAFVVLASVLGPKKPSLVKSEPFECGEIPFSLPIGHVSIKFSVISLINNTKPALSQFSLDTVLPEIFGKRWLDTFSWLL